MDFHATKATRVMESIEMFTGGGGLALGTHQAGFRHAAVMEWNSYACDTLRRNVERSRAGQIRSMAPISHWQVHEADIRKMIEGNFFEQFESRCVDLVAGGVPCQPFSLGGKHKAHTDTRDMFPDFVEVVRQVQPRAFIVENVKGLLRQSFSSYFQYILLRLNYPDVGAKPDEDWRDHLHRLEETKAAGVAAGLQYDVVFELLNAADFGVPQARERVFLVGFRSDLGVDWHFPSPTHSRDALVHDQFVTGKYWERHGISQPTNVPRWCSERAIRAMRDGEAPTTQPWLSVRDALADLPEPTTEGSSRYHNHILREGAKSYPGHTGSPIDFPSKTLKAGVHGVPGGENMMVRTDGSLRYFSVREAARIQKFPDDWVFEGAWSEAMRQLGNAVPVQLAQVVARSVAAELARKSAPGC